MNREELALVWFDYNDVSFLKTEKILKNFDKIDSIFDKNIVKNAIFDKDDIEIKEKLLNLNIEDFEKIVENDLLKYGLEAITFVSKNYPEKLKVIESPPLVLYAKGDVSLLGKKSIAMVGTRKPSDYGKIVCEKFTKELSSAGLVTVSGLAYGIDTIVAETTLACGGKTIAVMGGGLDSIYPSQNKSLSERVADSGLLVSEYRVGIKPQTYHFVNRNRIVTALALGTVIVEAGKNSGTMSTAKFTIDQSRELFVVPGNIYSPQSEGTNNLIDEIPDTFTISTDRILSRLKIEKKEKIAKVNPQIDLTESLILEAIEPNGSSFDDIAEKTGIDSAELSSKLVMMEMFGQVKKGVSNTYLKM